jgi:hypothetical protein
LTSVIVVSIGHSRHGLSSRLRLRERPFLREVAFQPIEKTSWPSLQFFEHKIVDSDFLFSIELAIVTNVVKKGVRFWDDLRGIFSDCWQSFFMAIYSLIFKSA